MSPASPSRDYNIISQICTTVYNVSVWKMCVIVMLCLILNVVTSTLDFVSLV